MAVGGGEQVAVAFQGDQHQWVGVATDVVVAESMAGGSVHVLDGTERCGQDRSASARNCARLVTAMDTSTRLIRLLTLFTSRPTWTATELTERLGVTDRTLRRDVTRLRELGYPIVSATGPHGGYELGAGGALPPLLLDDDEAVAVSVALTELARDSPGALGEAGLSALSKLRQVLPATLRARVEALDEVVVGVPRLPGRGDVRPGGIAGLLDLAGACRRRQRVRFSYVDNAGRTSERRVEPHRLVTLNRIWYLVGFDLDRDDWRTFRVDRIDELVDTGHRNAEREAPDAAAQVATGIALHSFGVTATVRLHVGPRHARTMIGPTAGVIDTAASDDEHTIVRIGGDPDWIAHYLARLPVRYDVIEPAEVRAELRKLGRRLQRHHAG